MGNFSNWEILAERIAEIVLERLERAPTYVSYKQLAEELGWSQATIQRKAKRYEEAGGDVIREIHSVRVNRDGFLRFIGGRI